MRESKKNFWSFHKSKRKLPSVPTIVKYCGQFLCTLARQVEACNHYFFSSFSDPPPCVSSILNLNAMLSSILLTFSVVESLLRDLDISKAYEPVSLPTDFFFFAYASFLTNHGT